MSIDNWNEVTQQAHNKWTEKNGRDFNRQRNLMRHRWNKDGKCKAGQDTQGKEYKVKQETKIKK